MAPRMRDPYYPQLHPPPFYHPAVKRRVPSPRAPLPQARLKTPFELFAAEHQVPQERGGNANITEYSVDVDAEWEKLSPEQKQVWEARYGRQVLEQQDLAKSSHGPTVEDLDEDLTGDWSTDTDGPPRRSPLKERKSSKKKKSARLRTKIPHVKASDSGQESVAGSKPVTKSKVKYRTELYRSKKDVDGNLVSDYFRTTFHDQPPKLQWTTTPGADAAPEPVDDTLPIFEVTTFLAAPAQLNFNFKGWDTMGGLGGGPPMMPGLDPYVDPYDNRYPMPPPMPPTLHRSQMPPREVRFNGVDSLSTPSEDDFLDEESELDPDKPIEIEGEAGTILEIHSPLIIDAIQKVGPGYPGLALEGSSLTVTEPFAAFIHFREQVRGYYDPLDPVTKKPDAVEETPFAIPSSSESKAPESLSDDIRQEGADHVKELYQFMDHLYLKSVTSERERWTLDVPMCTFEWSWLLFPPGTIIYEPTAANAPVSKAFVVKRFKFQGLFDESRRTHTASVNPHRLKSRQDPHFKNHLEKIIIVGYYLRHDGRKWMSQTREFKIFPFKGEKRIIDLPVYPAKYFDDPESATRKRLIQRGKRYHSLSSRGQFEYHGETLSGARRRLEGRIMVDSETYYYDRGLTRKTKNIEAAPYRRSNRDVVEVEERNSDSDQRSYYSASSSATNSDAEPFNIIKESTSRRRRAPRTSRRGRPQIQDLLDGAKEQTDEADKFFMICHSELRAWVLKERDWVRLSVESVFPCNFDERMIDDLQITPGAKRLIQAFSQSYSMSLGSPVEQKPSLSSAGWSADFVPGKGRGQIMLLHGRPGVGKTTCAECIAELTKRPLLTITCGDLGTNSYLVEQELTRWLRLGALWNAVLLFDEADVFLESREHGDIERNSLVSVFLRALEYYQGLMFLTTNRIGMFDEAILSRVHVILHFPDLTDIERAKIWDTSFRKLAEERQNIKVDFSLYDFAYREPSIKKLNWNGREIRNAFNTMVALAEFDAHVNNRYSKDGKVEVRREHLQEVAMMSGDFKKYMKSLRGMGSAGYAKGLGLRDDEFGNEAEKNKKKKKIDEFDDEDQE